MLATSLSPKLYGIITAAFDLWEERSGNIVREEVRLRYASALYEFLFGALSRVDDARFIDSFYDSVTTLYIRLDSNAVFAQETIDLVLELLDDDIEARYEILYSGKKNSLDLIINYTRGLLTNVVGLAEIDSARLLQLINFYSEYKYERPKPATKLLRRSDVRGRLLRRRFIDIHKEKVYVAASAILSAAGDMNSAVADTADYVSQSYFSKTIPEVVLRQSWGGEGLSIYESARDLDVISKYFGRIEDSVAGESDFIQRYLDTLKSCSFGTASVINNYVVQGQNLFGRFNRLFASTDTFKMSIWGLDFLRPLTRTRAFQSVHRTLDPIEYLFSDGIKDRLGTEKLGRIEARDVLPISLYLNNLLRKAYKVGGSVISLLYSIDRRGRLVNYEGLGSIAYPLKALSEVFPVKFSGYMQSRIGGVLGALENLVNSIEQTQNHLYPGALPGDTLNSIVPWIDSIRTKVEAVITSIEITGHKPGDIIPNIPLEVGARTREDFRGFFERRGYSQESIEKILGARSLPDLVRGFSPRMTAADAKSFMRSYDLAALVYSLAGEAGVLAVVEYLTGPDERGLARVFSLLEKDPDRFLKVDQFELGKLIGGLYSIQRAANPQPLEKLIPLIRAKNSEIGQSLKIVADFGLDYPIKDALDINILSGLINQSRSGYADQSPLPLDYDCADCLVEAPNSLRRWVGLIDESKGFATTELQGFFENRPGITHKELREVLNMSANPGFSRLGGILEGSRGGEFTAVLRDVQKSGLGLLMRQSHSSSVRRANSVVPQLQNENLTTLVDNLKGFVIDLQLVVYRLLVSTESATTEMFSADDFSYDNIINLINKPAQTAVAVINALKPDSSGRVPYRYNRTLLQTVLEASDVAEPPGIGNSPRIPRMFKPGTLTPELASLLRAPQTPALAVSSLSGVEFAPFIRIDQTQDPRGVKSGVSTATAPIFPERSSEWVDRRDGLLDVEPSDQPPQSVFSQYDEFSPGLARPGVMPVFNTSAAQTYFNPQSDRIIDQISSQISSPITGSYIISPMAVSPSKNNLMPPDHSGKHNPIESCVRFGTPRSKCLRLFKDYKEVECDAYYFNKSSLIEDSLIEGSRSLAPGAIPVDRPLGVSSLLNPGSSFSQNAYKALPYYLRNYSGLIEGLTSKGEPYSLGEVVDEGPGLSNTSVGLNYFLNKYPYPKDPQECTKYRSISLVQKCMNLLRCKKLRQGPTSLGMCEDIQFA